MGGSNLFVGTLDLLILHSVRGGQLHGYGIGSEIRAQSSGVLTIEEGALYPALHRLEARGLLRSEWGKTDTGRRAKFYRLTGAGSERLAEQRKEWKDHSGAVDAVLES